MPLYEYQCQNCSRTFEKRQKFSDPELTECPHCSGKLEKLISAPAVQFKGGGWYADLYSSSKGAKKSSGDTGAAATTTTASDSSSSSSNAPASAPSPAPSTSSSTTK
ncbi:FmdB family zinc ribbon protein [Terriglobus sp. RCC_193]|uniref:FmdB family zinc ribbon protein n=1 Tax=Terriglobus sp. RCC_193 TaxID=3239218 RepID=UPI003524156E